MKRDAFIGYSKDTPAAVVFQATHQLRGQGSVVSSREWGRMEHTSIPGPKADEEDKHSDVWKKKASFLTVLLTWIRCMKLEKVEFIQIQLLRFQENLYSKCIWYGQFSSRNII